MKIAWHVEVLYGVSDGPGGDGDGGPIATYGPVGVNRYGNVAEVVVPADDAGLAWDELVRGGWNVVRTMHNVAIDFDGNDMRIEGLEARDDGVAVLASWIVSEYHHPPEGRSSSGE